jgi:Na+/proline symporter
MLYNLTGAFMFLGLISLIHSTFDSFLNNGAVSFSKDIVGKIIKLDDKQTLWLSQQATIAIAFLGLIIAIWKNDLIDILFLGYTIWVPTILASLIWILYNKDKKLQPLSFWSGLFTGGISWWLFEYVITDTFPAIVAGLTVNFGTILIVQRYKKSRQKKIRG